MKITAKLVFSKGWHFWSDFFNADNLKLPQVMQKLSVVWIHDKVLWIMWLLQANIHQDRFYWTLTDRQSVIFLTVGSHKIGMWLLKTSISSNDLWWCDTNLPKENSQVINIWNGGARCFFQPEGKKLGISLTDFSFATSQL